MNDIANDSILMEATNQLVQSFKDFVANERTGSIGVRINFNKNGAVNFDKTEIVASRRLD